jgi:hypothetical protein
MVAWLTVLRDSFHHGAGKDVNRCSVIKASENAIYEHKMIILKKDDFYLNIY